MARADRDRWLALGLGLLALALAYLLGLHWWWTQPQLELRGQLIELRDQELRLRMNAAQREAVQQRLNELQTREAGDSAFLPEDTTELATAGLVQRLESVVERASPDRERCQLLQRSPTRPRQNERFQRVQVEVRLRCGSEELANILHALESDRPALFVDNLSILQRRGVGQAAGQQGALDISFELYGYLRRPVEGAGDA